MKDSLLFYLGANAIALIDVVKFRLVDIWKFSYFEHLNWN